MQVVKPVDVADMLRIELDALNTGYRVYCSPIRPDLAPGDVVITALGGNGASASTHVYDVSIGCYATSDVFAEAMADDIAGAIASLPLRDTSTQFNTADIAVSYEDNDPRAPQLARRSFRASVIVPGAKLTF